MSRFASSIATLVVLALPSLALPSLARAQAKPSADLGVAAIRSQWQSTIGYIRSAAEELSEADFGYKPVASVRTFGELVGHVAGSQFSFCAAALGEPARAEDAVEKAAKTKAALVKALKESIDYCARAYALNDAAVAASASLFGQSMTRMTVLALNAVHDGEHYGNIVTYMRMKGMVPPSSRR